MTPPRTSLCIPAKAPQNVNGEPGSSSSAVDPPTVPDFDHDFITQSDLDQFAEALHAPEAHPVTALNDWRPIRQRVRRKPRKKRKTTKDETREGYVYTLLKGPLLLVVFGWILVLSGLYLLTRLYIWAYEHLFSWRGRREELRQQARSQNDYAGWVQAAKDLDRYLGNDRWKSTEEYAYYDFKTVRKVRDQLRDRRRAAEVEGQEKIDHGQGEKIAAVEELRALVEACVKDNFAGIENPRIYSETYYGTKDLVQEFIDELEKSLHFLLSTNAIAPAEKFRLAKHLHTNLGRTALCLSGGATFSYYHFGVIKALLDAGQLPDVITGTSGGALIAALVATRTDTELKQLLVPALAHRITACEEPLSIWLRRWWKTGARFDTIDWARKCSWFCYGSMTFREAYERTGRILNVTCVPSDPHSPSILTNYLTAPDCVIWSAVLASAAVPGILNPVVLMSKRNGRLLPYSFGHKWKDGSLRTDIPLRALNLHFNVNFTIVSQVNPHINLFFFSSRGTVGRPVTHRKGRGWRGGFLGSALEQYLKLDLYKWLKVLRHLELLPRPMGQDWSQVWLQTFSGTITIWPRSRLSDFWHILSDPTPQRLAQMLHVGQQSCFPKLLFIENRMKLERLIEQGLLSDSEVKHRPDSMHLHGQELRRPVEAPQDVHEYFRGEPGDQKPVRRQGSGMMEELKRQSGVFFDDSEVEITDGELSMDEENAVDDEPTTFG